jgi:hypothetical protein
VHGQADIRRTAPWLLCGLSLGMLILSNTLRALFPDDTLANGTGWLEGTIGALGIAGIPVVGALMASRLPANPIGWLWCATGVAYAVTDLAGPLAQAAGWPLWGAWVLGGWAFVALIGTFVFVFLLFPDGRLPTHRWRWVARATVTMVLLLALAVPFAEPPIGKGASSSWTVEGAAGRHLVQAVQGAVYVLVGLALSAMFSLLVRFRRAGPVERRQLTWFLYATVLNAVVLALDGALGVLPDSLITTAVSSAATALLPVAVGVAVFRYRLFEIDRIVSRTVSYGLLTAGLIGLYLLVVGLLRPLLEPLTGSSTLAVAGSTLAVAAVFTPARRRLQGAVDRRFDRARYDADRAVQAFVARLRNQVDLDQVTAGLRETVVATVAPTRVTVWLRAPSRTGT